MQSYDFPEILNEISKEVIEYQTLYIFGFVLGLIFYLITQLFFNNISVFLAPIFALVTSLFFGILKSDITQLLSFVDYPILILSSYIYVRFSMSMSRSLLMKSEHFKENIILLLIIPVSMIIFIISNCFEKTNEAYSAYGVSCLIFILTIIIDCGIISDACIIILQIIISCSKSVSLAFFISVVRVSIASISYVSLLFKLPSSKYEATFAFFKIKKLSTRIILTSIMFLYFFVSPNLRWAPGDELNPFPAIASTVIYLILLVHEKYALDDPSFFGYNSL